MDLWGNVNSYWSPGRSYNICYLCTNLTLHQKRTREKKSPGRGWPLTSSDARAWPAGAWASLGSSWWPVLLNRWSYYTMKQKVRWVKNSWFIWRCRLKFASDQSSKFSRALESKIPSVNDAFLDSYTYLLPVLTLLGLMLRLLKRENQSSHGATS